jgi:hypothetical protein
MLGPACGSGKACAPAGDQLAIPVDADIAPVSLTKKKPNHGLP